MYNLDELKTEDLSHMKRYIGELFIFNEEDSDSKPKTFLKTIDNGETVIHTLSEHEIEVIFSPKLFKQAHSERFILDFYADINEDDVLYNIKELIVYNKYFPQY
jgi:hypothetical protein